MRAPHITSHSLPGTKTMVVYCGHCTGALHLALPAKVADICEAMDQFIGRHQACKEK